MAVKPRVAKRPVRSKNNRDASAESELARMERRYRGLLEAAPDAMVVVDQRGEIVIVNAQAETQFGYTRDALIGKPVTTIIPIGFAERLVADDLRSTADALAQQIGTGIELTGRRKDNSEFPIEIMLSPLESEDEILVTAAIRNITVRKAAEREAVRSENERKDTEREVIESRRVFEDVVENSDAAVLDCDYSGVFRAVQEMKRAGVRSLRNYINESEERLSDLADLVKIDSANDSALRMFRVSRREQIPRQPARTVDAAEAMFHGVKNLKRSEDLQTGDGPVPVIYSLRIPQTEEEARHVSIIFFDLSGIKLAEAARQATIAKSKFLSSMSHEIRTPLNGLIGNLELLSLTELDDDQVRLIGDADKAGKALMALIGNILDFSKIEAGKLSLEIGEIDPAGLVEEAVDVLQSRARLKDIFVNSVIGPDVPSLIRGDAMRIRQILLNLIGNAVKFTDEGGVQVNLRVTAWHEQNCELRFEVHDSGHGIDHIRADGLFEPFYQGGRIASGVEGTGLGLSICKSLVEAFGGTIGCESVPGEGSTFWFSIPAEVALMAPPAPNLDLSKINVSVIGRTDDASKSLREYFTARGATLIDDAVPGAPDSMSNSGGDVAIAADVAIVTPGEGDIPEIARRLRHDNIVPLFYGAEPSPRRRLRQGFAAAVPPDAKASYLDRNILLLVGHAKTRERLIAQQSTYVSANAADFTGKRILVLEDRLVNQVVIQRQLAKLGIECALAVDGVRGLKLVRYRHFDLVLCDCSMPEMSGYDFTRALRKRELADGKGRHMPVVALTANAFREDADKCFECGMDDFISKPVTLDRLTEMLARWLAPAELNSAPTGPPNSKLPHTPPVIEIEFLSEILGTRDPGLLNEVLTEFLGAACEALVDVKAAVSSGDSGAIVAAAHGAKGEARSAAATALADLYGELENAAKDEDRGGADRLVGRVAAEVHRVEEFINDRIGRSSP